MPTVVDAQSVRDVGALSSVCSCDSWQEVRNYQCLVSHWTLPSASASAGIFDYKREFIVNLASRFRHC